MYCRATGPLDAMLGKVRHALFDQDVRLSERGLLTATLRPSLDLGSLQAVIQEGDAYGEEPPSPNLDISRCSTVASRIKAQRTFNDVKDSNTTNVISLLHQHSGSPCHHSTSHAVPDELNPLDEQ